MWHSESASRRCTPFPLIVLAMITLGFSTVSLAVAAGTLAVLLVGSGILLFWTILALEEAAALRDSPREPRPKEDKEREEKEAVLA